MRNFFFILFLAFTLPRFAFADVFDVITLGINAFEAAIPLTLTLAIVVFLWGMVKFVAHADDEKAVLEGKAVMVYGLVAVFVIVSLWGIVGFIQQTFSLTSIGGTTPTIQTSIP